MKNKSDKSGKLHNETVKGRKILDVFRPEELPPETPEPDLPDFGSSLPPRGEEQASSRSSEGPKQSSGGESGS